VGAITDIVRRYVPATYRALVESTTPTGSLFATGDLQALADYVKFKLFATVVSEQDEALIYDPVLRQFIGKLTTIQFIPAAIDFWDSQLAQKNTTGTAEVITYRDHLAGLKHLFDELSQQVAEESLQLGLAKPRLTPSVSYGDGEQRVLVTPDPQTFGGAYSRTRQRSYLDLLPWRVHT
jgi:hypothetical protein